MESPSNELPQSLLEALPSDPYDQLEVACKITSMAVTARVGKLEAEAKYLQRLVADKELLVSDLQVRVGELQQALKDSSAQLSHALHEQVFTKRSFFLFFFLLVFFTLFLGFLSSLVQYLSP